MKKVPSTTTPTIHNQASPVSLCLVLKVPEFGARYGVKRRTVFRWLAQGLPHLKLSARKTKIPVQEGDRWIEKNFLRQRIG